MNKHKFEHRLVGNGKVTVIFLNGFRISLGSWNKVYPEVVQDNKVLLFNRLGVGSSAKAQAPQAGNLVVSEMRDLFSELKLDPPYVFVAHSLGGIFANLYARTYKDSVSGIVFVDSPHPLEIAKQRELKPPFILRVINGGLKVAEKWFDQYKYSEDECLIDTVSLIQRSCSFPAVPIAVVSGTQKMPLVPQKAFAVHLWYQEKLLQLSPNARHYLCENSSHFPQITEPQKVLSAIFDTLDAVKSKV